MYLTEYELVQSLKLSLETAFINTKQEKKYVILNEVNLGYGIADLVISKLRAQMNSFNLGEVLSHNDIIVYDIVDSYGKVDFKTIAIKSGCGKYVLNKVLKKLITMQLVKEVDSYFSILKKYQPVTGEVIAIEAKLKNWKQAIEQARRYFWFANYTYVALDAQHAAPAVKNIQTFMDTNVGLVLIDDNSNVKILFQPEKSEPKSISMSYRLNEIIKSHLNQEH